MFRDKDKPMVAKVFMWLSFLCALLAFVGAVYVDVYLASTQWILVGVLMGVWGLFFLLEAEFRSS